MFERYTEKARRVIFFARYEASQFGSPCVESEHLVLGIWREDKVLASQFLGLWSFESIRNQIKAQTTARDQVATSVDLPLSHDCKRILAYAAEESARLGHEHIGTGHLLFGVMREEKCFGAQVLRDHGVRPGQVRDWVANPGSQPSRETKLDLQDPWAGPRGVDLERYSLKAARAILFARSEAAQFASSAIEAEHLLLGLLREDKAISEQLLHSRAAVESIRKRIESNNKGEAERTPLAQFSRLQASIASIVGKIERAIANHDFQQARLYADEEREQREALRLLGERYGTYAFAVDFPLSRECERVLNQGAEEATLLKQRYIGTEHLLLGILREEKSFAADILHESGLQLAQAREEIARWNQEQGGDHV